LSEEYKRWEARYSPPDYIFGKAPNYFLAKCKPLLPASGRVLAIADGEGRNSIWLAEQGLEVHAIDFSPTAQDKALALAHPSRLLNRWLAAMFVLFRPQIEDLLVERDRVVARWSAQHLNCDVFEDRSLDKTSLLDISLENRLNGSTT
jgi:hypothetical protein